MSEKKHTPKLQNSPLRTEAARELQRLFVPSPGQVLILADFSALELRMAAAAYGR